VATIFLMMQSMDCSCTSQAHWSPAKSKSPQSLGSFVFNALKKLPFSGVKNRKGEFKSLIRFRERPEVA
jgi:hypothetical protein